MSVLSNGQPSSTEAAAPDSLWGKLRVTGEMIKFEHSVFALPFALLGAMLAARGWPTGWQLFWIVIAMVGARSAAMSFNRLIDRRIDAANPRTATRALPTGALGVGFVAAFAAASSAVLMVAAYKLNPLAFELSPAALAVLLAARFNVWDRGRPPSTAICAGRRVARSRNRQAEASPW